jgi:hypothetical protein
MSSNTYQALPTQSVDEKTLENTEQKTTECEVFATARGFSGTEKIKSVVLYNHNELTTQILHTHSHMCPKTSDTELLVEYVFNLTNQIRGFPWFC